MTDPALQPQAEGSDELVYASAVLILSEDLYPRKLEIIREYVQNASDALDAFEGVAETIEDDWEPVIKISVHGKSLVVFDTGIGMDSEEMVKLKRVAYSEKKQGEEAGYKGIGRLAGIAVADKLKISSTSYGDPKLHSFEFRAARCAKTSARKGRPAYRSPHRPSSTATQQLPRLTLIRNPTIRWSNSGMCAIHVLIF